MKTDGKKYNFLNEFLVNGSTLRTEVMSFLYFHLCRPPCAFTSAFEIVSASSVHTNYNDSFIRTIQEKETFEHFIYFVLFFFLTSCFLGTSTSFKRLIAKRCMIITQQLTELSCLTSTISSPTLPLKQLRA